MNSIEWLFTKRVKVLHFFTGMTFLFVALLSFIASCFLPGSRLLDAMWYMFGGMGFMIMAKLIGNHK